MMTGVLTFAATAMIAADYTVDGQYVTIPVKETKAGGAQLVRLQVVNDRIIRVQATSKAQLPEEFNILKDRLAQFFQTKVQMSCSPKGKGKISILFDNEEQLEYIMNVLDRANG